jgi:hypothetical protein
MSVYEVCLPILNPVPTILKMAPVTVYQIRRKRLIAKQQGRHIFLVFERLHEPPKER